MISKVDQIGITQFLNDFPEMAITLNNSNKIILEGNFRFRATLEGSDEINDSYNLRLDIPKCFPRDIPIVEEIGNKIPHKGEFHLHDNDYSLCLGSPFRILETIHQHPSISGYVEKCLAPYLFAVSHKLENGRSFIFGELGHGVAGLYDDYSDLLGLKNDDQVKKAVYLLGLKKRIANKKICPCGCGKRLGKCTLHDKLNKFRKMAPRSWFKNTFI